LAICKGGPEWYVDPTRSVMTLSTQAEKATSGRFSFAIPAGMGIAYA